MSSLWEPPKGWPPGARVAKSGSFVLIGDDLHGMYCPVPILEVELELQDRPSGSKSLPVHPLGAHRWYEFSRGATMGLLANANLPREEVKQLARLVWAKCQDCYRPGQPVRSVFEEVLASAPNPIKASNSASEDDLLTQKLAYLAVLGVVRGLFDWLESGDSDIRA